jgi:hypothetical protein
MMLLRFGRADQPAFGRAKGFAACFVAFGGLALATAACSSDDGPKYGSVDSFLDALADAECAGVATRCGLDRETCVRARKTYWRTWASARSDREYVASKAERCVDDWRRAHEDGALEAREIDPFVRDSVAERCERVFEGKGEALAPCNIDLGGFDCAGDLICDQLGDVARNTFICAKRVEKKNGEGCANPGEVCERGFYCAGEIAVCVPKKRENEACGPASPCAEDFRCDGTACRPRLKAMDACTSRDECPSSAPLCTEVAGARRCLASLTFGTASPACTPYGL